MPVSPKEAEMNHAAAIKKGAREYYGSVFGFIDRQLNSGERVVSLAIFPFPVGVAWEDRRRKIQETYEPLGWKVSFSKCERDVKFEPNDIKQKQPGD